MKNKNEFISKQSSLAGFTLMETIVVVVIISVLVISAFPSFQRYIIRSRNQEGIQVLYTLLEAQLDHARDTGAYSTNLADLLIDIPTMKNFDGITLYDGSLMNCSYGGPLLPAIARVENSSDGYQLYITEDSQIYCCGTSMVQCTETMGLDTL